MKNLKEFELFESSDEDSNKIYDNPKEFIENYVVNGRKLKFSTYGGDKIVPLSLVYKLMEEYANQFKK